MVCTNAMLFKVQPKIGRICKTCPFSRCYFFKLSPVKKIQLYPPAKTNITHKPTTMFYKRWDQDPFHNYIGVDWREEYYMYVEIVVNIIKSSAMMPTEYQASQLLSARDPHIFMAYNIRTYSDLLNTVLKWSCISCRLLLSQSISILLSSSERQ